MTKYIFVTGGVVSSVGKGITVASIGTLLKSRGLTVSVQKLDPYLNVDPGTMSPYQHGEVFVTKDGAETDLDLGNYERFIDTELTADSNITSGQIYSAVIAKERRGDFLGGTIQVIPHVTTEIKDRFKKLAKNSAAEVILVEVGGTVGDIEGQPFLEAIRQMRNDVGRENVLYIHVTLLPYIGATKELKTKPTQHSVNELRRMGIQPDVIVCRADYPISDGIRDKISLFCDVERQAVIPLPTVSSIYEVPLVLESEGMGNLVVERLGLKTGAPELGYWQRMVSCRNDSCQPVSIAVVGKYVELEDAYFSVRESLRHAGLQQNRKIDITWVHSEELEKNNDVEAKLRSVQGIVVPGGFGIRGIEGMIKTARYARENKIPYLGLCLGMQILVIEFARLVLKSDKPNSTEFDPETPFPVIDLLPEQRTVEGKGGTMRLGNYVCHLQPGTRTLQAYGENACVILERHRHRFEFNNDFRQQLGDAGLVFSGLSPDGRLVEICELRDHPGWWAASSIPNSVPDPTVRMPCSTVLSARPRTCCAKVRSRPSRSVPEEAFYAHLSGYSQHRSDPPGRQVGASSAAFTTNPTLVAPKAKKTTNLWSRKSAPSLTARYQPRWWWKVWRPCWLRRATSPPGTRTWWSKIPSTPEGLEVTSKLAQAGIKVNMTLCFSANQALLGALAGAAFVSPFVGRLDDIGQDGMALVKDIMDIYKEYDFDTEVIAASIRHPLHCVAAAQAGADIATVPFKVAGTDDETPPDRGR